jgi:hypothetical protein
MVREHTQYRDGARETAYTHSHPEAPAPAPMLTHPTPLPQPSTSITSLLNSLHSHLQAQTTLLPTLHAQLGLPATALADELAALQRALTQAVEDQIEGRRREVEVWMARCDEAEEECANYGAVLGGNVKGAGVTVGEIRKEHVLPRRYEMLTEMQEKLRQVCACFGDCWPRDVVGEVMSVRKCCHRVYVVLRRFFNRGSPPQHRASTITD